MESPTENMLISEKYITILGSTGSIGTQSLDVCREQGIRVEALTAQSNVALMEAQIREFKPRFAALSDPVAAADLKLRVADTGTRVFAGAEGILDLISLLAGDTVVNAIIGGAGLLPTLAIIEAGKNLALANKESLVTAGEVVLTRAREKGVPVLPIDSEHSALFQCLMNGRREEVSRLILTASGGPFFGKKREELEGVTREQALAHPTWKMGQKITIDSATLANKAFEMIEAAYLFDIPMDQIEVLVHRESVVHSLVEYIDGAQIAQLSSPDMRMCIRYALSYPARAKTSAKPTNLWERGSLTFFPPDEETFKPLGLARYAMNGGGLLPAVFHGANDAAVELFLENQIRFLDIADLTEEVLHKYKNVASPSLDALLAADRDAADRVRALAK